MTLLSGIWILITSVIGVFLISVAAEGYLFAKVPILVRAVSAVTALLLINSSFITDVVGLALCAAIVEGVVQKLEHNAIEWITPSDIPNYQFCPADKEILEKMIAEF